MKKTILIIDDSLPIRYLLEAILGHQYTVVSAQDGLAAMSWLSKGSTPDLIITDLHMPNIDGWELLAHLSASYLYKDIPAIVITGALESVPDDFVGKYNNVHAVIQKPFDPANLLQQVGEIINGELATINA